MIVSHDRHFISQVANKVWFIENKEVKEYPGTYDEYVYWQSQRTVDSPSAPPAQEASKKTVPKNSEADQAQQRELARLQREVHEVETEITALEKEKKKIEQTLSQPDIYSDNRRQQETTQQFADVEKKLGQKTQQWETLAQRAEELETALANES